MVDEVFRLRFHLQTPQEQDVLNKIVEDVKNRFGGVRASVDVQSESLAPYDVVTMVLISGAGGLVTEAIIYLLRKIANKSMRVEITEDMTYPLAKALLAQAGVHKPKLVNRTPQPSSVSFVFENRDEHLILVSFDGRLSYERRQRQ